MIYEQTPLDTHEIGMKLESLVYASAAEVEISGFSRYVL